MSIVPKQVFYKEKSMVMINGESVFNLLILAAEITTATFAFRTQKDLAEESSLGY